MDSSCGWSNLFNKFFNHITLQIEEDVATYLASHVDRATILCLLDIQVKAIDPR